MTPKKHLGFEKLKNLILKQKILMIMFGIHIFHPGIPGASVTYSVAL